MSGHGRHARPAQPPAARVWATRAMQAVGRELADGWTGATVYLCPLCGCELEDGDDGATRCTGCCIAVTHAELAAGDDE